MQQSRTEIKQNQILWRHSQVIRLASDGLSEREIATQLQISDSTVHRDIQILKQQAKQDVLAIHPGYIKLITALRTAVEKGEGTLDKEATSHHDLFDAFRLSMQFWHQFDTLC